MLNKVVKIIGIATISFVAIVSVIHDGGGIFVSTQEIEDRAYSRQLYEDGVYYAKIDYYNSKTDYRSSYEAKIELRGDTLIKIIFDNGGYLDRNKIEPVKVEKNKNIVVSEDESKTYLVNIGDEQND